MNRNERNVSLTARSLALLISVVVMLLGACAVIDGYAPGRFTRFGYAAAISGVKAKEFGLILVLLGLLPLLAFCKNSRQASFLGSVLGALLVAAIFMAAYS